MLYKADGCTDGRTDGRPDEVRNILKACMGVDE